MASDMIQSYLRSPASIPPDGTVANLENPPKHNTGPLVLLVLCLVLTVVFGVARAYSRIFVVKNLRIEDYLGLLAFLSYMIVVYSYLRFWTNVGFFVHMWDLPGSALVEVGYDGFIIVTGYCFVLLFAKTAILLEWVHLFVPRGTRNNFYWSARVMMVVNILLYSSALIANFAGCQPLERFWNFWISGHCVDRKARNTVTASFNVILDVLILLLPQPVIWKLKMTSARKNGIFVVFSVGLLVIATSVGCLVGIVTMDYPAVFTDVFDTSYQFGIELEWCIAEVTPACVMLVFCVPALPKMISEHSVLLTSRITDVWRSWTRRGRGRRASKSTNSTKNWKQEQAWPRLTSDHPDSREQIIDEECLQTKHTRTSLIELPRMNDQYLEFNRGAAPQGIPQHAGAGIVKTADVYYYGGGNMSANQFFQQQHPWVKH